jgi:hypothetical protein
MTAMSKLAIVARWRLAWTSHARPYVGCIVSSPRFVQPRDWVAKRLLFPDQT